MMRMLSENLLGHVLMAGFFFFLKSGSPVDYKAKNGLYLLSARTAGKSPMLGGRHLSEMVTVEGVRLMKSMSSSRSGACLVPVEDGSSPGQRASRLVIVRVAYVGVDRID